jgi:protein TonB
MNPELPPQTLEDLVFAHRNRAYGAYSLRHGYRNTLRRAFVLGVAAVSLGLVGPSVLKRSGSDENEKVTLADPMTLPQPEPEQPVVTPPPPEVETPKVSTTRLLPPEIQPDELVTEEVPVATQEELQEAQAGETTQLGDVNAGELVIEPGAGAGKSREEIVEIKPDASANEFLPVEQQPEFPGGTAALRAFLEKNLRYPAEAARAGVSGRVYLSFVVGANGQISDVTVTKGLGFGCDEEALRVVKTMPRWTPGRQSGRAVKARFNLPLVFALE